MKKCLETNLSFEVVSFMFSCEQSIGKIFLQLVKTS